MTPPDRMRGVRGAGSLEINHVDGPPLNDTVRKSKNKEREGETNQKELQKKAYLWYVRISGLTVVCSTVRINLHGNAYLSLLKEIPFFFTPFFHSLSCFQYSLIVCIDTSKFRSYKMLLGSYTSVSSGY